MCHKTGAHGVYYIETRVFVPYEEGFKRSQARKGVVSWIHLNSLCILRVLCASVVSVFRS